MAGYVCKEKLRRPIGRLDDFVKDLMNSRDNLNISQINEQKFTDSG
jgi:hypothetical protein